MYVLVITQNKYGILVLQLHNYNKVYTQKPFVTNDLVQANELCGR